MHIKLFKIYFNHYEKKKKENKWRENKLRSVSLLNIQN